MSVIYKLTLSLFALTLLVFGVVGTYHLHVEARDLKTSMEQETRLLGYSLLVSVENALRDRQTEDVQKLIQQLDRIEPSIDVSIYIQNRRAIRSDAESLAWPEQVEQSLYQAALAGEQKQFYFPADDSDLIVLSLPFNVSPSLKGNLAVIRSLQAMKQDLKKTKIYFVLSVLAFIVFTSLLCFFLGHLYITRPLQQLRQAMRSFRNNMEPPTPLPISSNDELSAVTDEFNRMTAELFTAHQQLDAETQQRRQLQRALQDADKLVTIGQLAAGLAHEIGSPLQIVNGRARALAENNSDVQEVRRIAGILVEQTDRITRIVQRLLDFTPRRSPQLEPCDVTKAVAEVLDMLKFEANRQNTTMSFIHPDNLPHALLCKDNIQQIVLNLITNALAAIPGKGNIQIDLSLQPSSDSVTAKPTLKLTVSDTGTGIAPEHIPDLFEPYFTTRSSTGGTGLGLAVVKALITEMNGKVTVETEVGKGSRFIVELPCREAS